MGWFKTLTGQLISQSADQLVSRSAISVLYWPMGMHASEQAGEKGGDSSHSTSEEKLGIRLFSKSDQPPLNRLPAANTTII